MNVRMPLGDLLAERRRLIGMIRFLSRTRRARYRSIAVAAEWIGRNGFQPRPRSR